MTASEAPLAGVRLAALFVQPDGCYVGLPDVDAWPERGEGRQRPYRWRPARKHSYATNGGIMKDELLKCPACKSAEVTVSHKQRFMANTGEHYCHSVKTHDADSEATCLDCQWIGRRDQLVHNDRMGFKCQ